MTGIDHVPSCPRASFWDGGEEVPCTCAVARRLGRKKRRKGKRVELELAKFLRDHGFTGAHRGQQYKGTADSADVVEAIPGIHCESKGVEAFETLHRWMEKCEKECAVTEDPAVFIKANRKRWLVVLDAKDFLDLMAELIERREHRDSKGTPGVPEVGSEDHRRHDGKESGVDAPSVARDAQAP